jgi:hypothetical protein
MPKKEIDSYEFKGGLSLRKVIFDCLEEDRKCFIMIPEKEKFAYVGILKIITSATLHNFIFNFPEAVRVDHLEIPFYNIKIKKEEVGKAIKLIKGISKKIEKEHCNIKRKLFKGRSNGEFTNKSKTKIITF